APVPRMSAMEQKAWRRAVVLVWVACAAMGCGRSKAGGSAPAGTLTIQGTLGPSALAAGASVWLAGPATRAVVADASGHYAFTGLVNGAYSVTPSKSGAAVSPTTRAVTLADADATGIDFTAGPFAANLTIDGSQTFQTVGGMGVNINVNSWKNGELAPALNLLTAAAGTGNGASLFRVIRDPMDWVA